MRILFFPIDIDNTEEVMQNAFEFGNEIFAASSELDEYENKSIKEFIKIPYITDPNFLFFLKNLIREKQITHIYTLHHVVWYSIKKYISNSEIQIELLGENPQGRFNKKYLKLKTIATKLNKIKFPEVKVKQKKKKINNHEYINLINLFLNIPGETDLYKLNAIVEIFRILPRGDIIEIGCLYGRSAFVFSYMLNRYNLGNLNCIDPWNYNKIDSQETNNQELENQEVKLDFALVNEYFKSNLSLYNNITIYNKKSSEAINEINEKYKNKRNVSLIHIDGNHSYKNVLEDVQNYSPLLSEGGWLVLDDYIWTFGDGPKKVGDELIQSGKYNTSFVIADSLFLRKNNEIEITS